MTIDQLAALIGALGGVAGLGTLIKGLRKLSSREVAESALQMLDKYGAQVLDLERRLQAATETIDDLQGKLRTANQRADSASRSASDLEERLRVATRNAARLSEELANANAELDILRHHVKDLGLQFPERRDEEG